MKEPVALIILDGFGYSPEKKYNAIAQAKKPTIDFFLKTYPHALLKASGKAVGLPDRFMGNSEVGHTTLGAGKIVPSPFLIMHEALEKNEIETNPIIQENFQNLAKTGNSLHLMGLLSDAGVNSHMEIIAPLLRAAQLYAIKKIVIHGFLDGRDTLGQAAADYLMDLDTLLKSYQNAQLGSITGRFYAMDRDKNWDRTDKTYQMLTQEQPIQFTNWGSALEYYYSENSTDEFIPPTLLAEKSTIKNDDGILFFNFRADRARQLTACFVDSQSVPFACPIKPAFFITPFQFDAHFKNPTLFKTEPVTNTLKEILSKNGKSIFTIAETEKYAHVTYFFDGGKELSFFGEQRTLIPSLKMKNYIDNPCMKAPEITNAVIQSLLIDPCDFYLINYANADMVGHSGNLEATIKAIECLDEQLKKLYEEIVQKRNGTMYITADHGNAEKKYDEKSKQPWTMHTTNPVPFMWIKKGLENSDEKLPLKGLSDVAPFILKNMN